MAPERRITLDVSVSPKVLRRAREGTIGVSMYIGRLRIAVADTKEEWRARMLQGMKTAVSETGWRALHQKSRPFTSNWCLPKPHANPYKVLNRS